jgi:hypothetical protein
VYKERRLSKDFVSQVSDVYVVVVRGGKRECVGVVAGVCKVKAESYCTVH